MKEENSVLVLYIILAFILGYASFFINNNVYATVLAAAGFFVGAFVLENFFVDEKKGYKWYFTNGGWIYFFVWFIVWVVFYNL